MNNSIYLIKTSRNNAARREIFRKSYLAQNQAYKFIIGTGKIDKNLDKEIDKNNDFIVGNFVDSYENLALKTYFGYKFVKGNTGKGPISPALYRRIC